MKGIIKVCGSLLITFLATGCHSRLTVEGDVLYDGKPLPNGSISFEPVSGKGRDFGGTITDGKYRVVSPPDTPSGVLTVRIRAAIKTGRQVPAGSPSPAGTMVDEVVSLPAAYNDKTKLTANLEPGKVNRFDFDLKSEAKR